MGTATVLMGGYWTRTEVLTVNSRLAKQAKSPKFMTLARLYSYDTLLEGLAEDFQNVAAKLRELIEKHNTMVPQRHLAWHGHLAPTAHARQAVDYVSNQGVEWVVLTNGIVWKAYRVAFTKPTGQDLVLEVDLLNLNLRTAADLNLLYLLCREGIVKSLLPEYYLHRQATSRFALGAIVLSEPMLGVVRRELRRLNPGVRVDLEEIKTVLMQKVIKREVMEGEAAEEARRRVRRSIGRALRTRQPRSVDEETESVTPASQVGEGSDTAPEAEHP
jgi:hypothetical protein